MNEYSFLKGFNQVQRSDIRTVRAELMEALGLSTRWAFHVRMRGRVIPNVKEARDIEAVFARYGITEVWGGESPITDHEPSDRP